MTADVENELSLGVLCFIVSRAVETEVLAALAEAGFDDLTQAQGRICARIGEHGTRIGDLAEQAQVTKQTATTTVDLLEGKGYVRRVPDPTDARATLVVFAERGRAAVAAARRAEERLYVGWERHLGARRTRQLREALELLREITDPYA
jgi:DNA-binding MarR family transcriptional regulator